MKSVYQSFSLCLLGLAHLIGSDFPSESTRKLNMRGAVVVRGFLAADELQDFVGLGWRVNGHRYVSIQCEVTHRDGDAQIQK